MRSLGSEPGGGRHCSSPGPERLHESRSIPPPGVGSYQMRSSVSRRTLILLAAFAAIAVVAASVALN